MGEAKNIYFTCLKWRSRKRHFRLASTTNTLIPTAPLTEIIEYGFPRCCSDQPASQNLSRQCEKRPSSKCLHAAGSLADVHPTIQGAIHSARLQSQGQK